jgi:hypothetical protein
MVAMYVLVLAAGMEPASAQAKNPCTGHAACTEVPAFVVMVTEFRPGAVGATWMVSATIRFTNKTPRELVVGYVDGSGVATDDRGNRYTVRPGAVAGIGTISTSGFDPKFTMQPGAGNEGRIEFQWIPGSRNDPVGTTWDVEFAVREIDPVANKQYKLGKQHVLQFRGFRDGWTARP